MNGVKLQDWVRAVISFALVGVFVYLMVTGKDFSPRFDNILMLVLGFWFAADRIGDFLAKVYTVKTNGKTKVEE